MKERVALGTADSHHRREAGLRTKLTVQKKRGKIADIRFLVISWSFLDFPVIEVKNLFLTLKLYSQQFPN